MSKYLNREVRYKDNGVENLKKGVRRKRESRMGRREIFSDEIEGKNRLILELGREDIGEYKKEIRCGNM